MEPKYYTYPGIFEPDGDGWTVTFPDLENCFTSADSVEEAILEAQAVLEDCLYFREKHRDEIPGATPLEEVVPSHPRGFAQIVVAFMPPVRKAWSNKAVKKTLTIPAWLDELAKEQKVNCSQVFQSALKEELRVSGK